MPGDRADHRGADLPLARRSRAPRRACSGSTMASIRSWLSLVMISKGSMPCLADVAPRRGRRPCPTPPFDAVSLAAPVMPGGAEVLDADDQAGVEELEARLDQPLLLERVADLHARALVVVAPSSPNPADASTLAPPMPSRPVDEPNSTARLPTPDARASTSRSCGQQPEAEHVDERVVLIGRVEHGLAADGRARRPSCRSRRRRTRRLRRSSGCGGRRTDRTGAGPSGRSGGRPRRRRRGGCPPTPVAAPW